MTGQLTDINDSLCADRKRFDVIRRFSDSENIKALAWCGIAFYFIF